MYAWSLAKRHALECNFKPDSWAFDPSSDFFKACGLSQVTLMVPGNYQGKKRIEQWNVHDQPGVYKVKLPCVPVRTLGTVMLEMVDKSGLYFSDEFALTFHLHYYRLLKWLIVFPLLGMVGVLLVIQPQDSAPLPSFSRSRHQLWSWSLCAIADTSRAFEGPRRFRSKASRPRGHKNVAIWVKELRQTVELKVLES